MSAYISEFCAAIRHPEYEKGEVSTYHVALTTWQPDALGTMRPQTATVTPEAAEAAGFSLDKVIGDVTAAMLRERDEARKEASTKAEELEKAQGTAEAAEAQAAQAIQVAMRHQELTAIAIADKQAVVEREEALLKEIDELRAAAEPKSLLGRIGAVFTG